MIRPTRAPRRLAVAAAALTLGLSASALAAHPKTGQRYSGFTSQPKLLGFAPPVSFKVSANGSKLLSFTYASFGCFGAGGFKPGVNPFKSKFAIKNVGTAAVAKNGHFSVKNAKTTYKVQHDTLITSSTITGTFKTASTATGTISFSQKSMVAHSKAGTCGPVHFTFSAKAG